MENSILDTIVGKKVGGVIGDFVDAGKRYVGITSIFPMVEEFLNLGSGIKMVNAQLGITRRVALDVSKNISQVAISSGLASQKLFDVAESSAKYNQAIGEEGLRASVQFADATNMNSSALGEFSAKMTAIGALSEHAYKRLLTGILSVRDAYGLSNDSVEAVLSSTEKYAKVLGLTGKNLVSASKHLGVFVSKIKEAGLETSVATDLLERIIDPDKLEENLLLLSKMGFSLQDLTVGNPIEDIEASLPRLQKISREIIAMPNRLLANEVSKMYGFNLEQMRNFANLDISERAVRDRKTLEDYRAETQTFKDSLLNVGNRVFGGTFKAFNALAKYTEGMFSAMGVNNPDVKATAVIISIASVVAMRKISQMIKSSFEKGGTIIRRSLTTALDSQADRLADIMQISPKTKSAFGEEEKKSSYKPTKIAELDETTKGSRIDSKKASRAFRKTNEAIRAYNEALESGLYESQARLQKFQQQSKSFTNFRKNTSEIMQEQIGFIDSVYGDNKTWFMKLGIEAQRKKIEVPKGFGPEKESAEYDRLKINTMQMYETALKNNIEIDARKARIESLVELGKRQGLTSAQQEEVNRLQSFNIRETERNTAIIDKLKSTQYGKFFLKDVSTSVYEDSERFSVEITNLRTKISDAQQQLDVERDYLSTQDKKATQDAISQMQRLLEELENTQAKVAEQKQALGSLGIQAEELGAVSIEETKVNVRSQLQQQESLLEELSRQQRMEALNMSLGLSANAGAVSRTLAKTKLLSGAVFGKIGGIMKSMLPGLGIGGGISGIAALGVSLLMRDEKFRENVQGLLAQVMRVVDPLVGVITKLIGYPLGLITKFVEGIANFFKLEQVKKDKEEEKKKKDVIYDMARYQEMKDTKEISSLIETLERLEKEMNAVAKNTGSIDKTGKDANYVNGKFILQQQGAKV